MNLSLLFNPTKSSDLQDAVQQVAADRGLPASAVPGLTRVAWGVKKAAELSNRELQLRSLR